VTSLLLHCPEPVEDHGERGRFGGGAGRSHDQEALAVRRGHVAGSKGTCGRNLGVQVKQRLRRTVVEGGGCRSFDLDGHQFSVGRDTEEFVAVAAPARLGAPAVQQLNHRMALATALLSRRPGRPRARLRAIIDRFEDSTRCDGIEHIRGNRQEAHVDVGQTFVERLLLAAAIEAFVNAASGCRRVEDAAVIGSHRQSVYG